MTKSSSIKRDISFRPTHDDIHDRLLVFVRKNDLSWLSRIEGWRTFNKISSRYKQKKRRINHINQADYVSSDGDSLTT